jgi:hypothetical protein
MSTRPNPFGIVRQMKFDLIGRHPIDDRALEAFFIIQF